MSVHHPKQAILLVGAPGAGKGTQGETVGLLPGYFHCSSGDIFRSLDKESELGKKFVEYSSTGNLVPDDLTIELVNAQLNKWIESHKYHPGTELLILDGIPRNLNQAKLMEQHVEILRVIHLDVPDRETLVSRMKNRAIQQNRFDDANEDTIRNRFSVYDELTKPILDFYGEERVTTIDAQRHPALVLHDLTKCLVENSLYKAL